HSPQRLSGKFLCTARATRQSALCPDCHAGSRATRRGNGPTHEVRTQTELGRESSFCRAHRQAHGSALHRRGKECASGPPGLLPVTPEKCGDCWRAVCCGVCFKTPEEEVVFFA